MTWQTALATGAVPLLALLVDRAFGEPRAARHPVVGMGRALDAMGRRLPAGPPAVAFAAGALGWSLGALVTLAVALLLQRALLAPSLARSLGAAGPLVWALATASLLKPMLALRVLLGEVDAVERALRRSLDAGRARTARICSRDTRALDAAALRETAIESLAENLNDSLIAPLLWFAVAGLPGAALYRWANTADAMWGYRDPRREWSGKFAARADDVLSWPSARLSAMLLRPAARHGVLRREASRTPSPNGGWPMAAMALRLGVRLGKPGVYVLNADGRRVDREDIPRAVALARRTAWQGAAALGALAAVVAAARP